MIIQNPANGVARYIPHLDDIENVGIQFEPRDQNPSVDIIEAQIIKITDYLTRPLNGEEPDETANITRISDYLPRPKITDLTNRDFPSTFRLI